MKAKTKRILIYLAVVFSTVLLIGIYLFMPFSAVGKPMEVDRAKTPSGIQVRVVQVFRAAIKPYRIYFYVKRPDGNWAKFHIADQYLYFRGQVLWNASRKGIEIRHYGAEYAFYDFESDSMKIEGEKKGKPAMALVSNPMEIPSDGDGDGKGAGGKGGKAKAGPAPDAGAKAVAAGDAGGDAGAPMPAPQGLIGDDECRKLEEAVDRHERKATACVKDEDCCLIVDSLLDDCLAANKAAPVQDLRDSVRALARYCGSPPRGCADVEPACLFGQCGVREPLIRRPSTDAENGLALCTQPYSPTVKTVDFASPDLRLLTDPRVDPAFGVDVPDGGGELAGAAIEVCVSTQGYPKSARVLGGAKKNTSPLVSLLAARILETWKFRPLVIDLKPQEFCTQVGYPLPAKK